MGRVGGEPPMGSRFELPQGSERPEVLVVDPADFEDIVGTDLDAVTLSLATAQVDHRRPGSDRRRAPEAGTVGLGRRTPFLLEG